MKFVPAPYTSYSVVKNDWIDDNGHMNSGYYLAAFDDGSCAMFDDLGLGWDYTTEGTGSIFILSASQDFLRELLESDRLRITTWLVTYDKCRVHVFQELYHADQGYLAARAEFMFVHVSLKTRKVMDMPDKALHRLAEIQAAHEGLVSSTFVGRQINLDWKSSNG